MDAGAILGQHGGLIRSIIRQKVSNIQAHDDLFQDVCVRVIEKIEFLRDGDTIAAWVATITRRTIINAYRQRQRSVVCSDVLDEVPTYSCDSLEAQDTIAAFNRLSPADREILLTFVAGTPLEDYALTKGIPYGTAKSRAWTARRNFRKELNR